MRPIFDARHWQQRAHQAMEVAEEATAIAEAMHDPEAKRLMLGIAGDYMPFTNPDLGPAEDHVDRARWLVGARTLLAGKAGHLGQKLNPRANR
jgi:hypothetical protein